MNHTFTGNAAAVRDQVNAAEFTDAAKLFILSKIADGEAELAVHVTAFDVNEDGGSVAASVTVTVHKQ